MRHCHHGLIAYLRGPEFSLICPLVNGSAEADLHRVVFSRVQPHVSQSQPVVRELDLPAVYDLLLENAELIPNGKARHRVAKPGRRIHIARSESSKPAVSKSRVRLHRAELVQREPERVQHLACFPVKAQIKQIVAQRCAHQKLHRHVIDLLALFFPRFRLERALLVFQHHPHRHAQRAIRLLFRRFAQLTAEHAQARLFDRLMQHFFCHAFSPIALRYSAI